MNLLITILIFMIQTLSLHDFSPQSSNQWRVVDDVVMGGRSSGNFKVNSEGNGVFYGEVSTENNGGFSSVRHEVKTINTEKFSEVVMKLKGDGKAYQFRLKPSIANYFSYIQTFDTNGEWQEIRIPFKDFYPSFRGRKLDQPNFDGSQIEEMTFLIANKKNENFKLEIDWISAK